MKWPITEERLDQWLFETHLKARAKRVASLTRDHQVYVKGGGNVFEQAAQDLGSWKECHFTNHRGQRVNVKVKGQQIDSCKVNLPAKLPTDVREDHSVDIGAFAGASINNAIQNHLGPEEIEFAIKIDDPQYEKIHSAILIDGEAEAMAAPSSNNCFVFDDPDALQVVRSNNAICYLLFVESEV